MGDIAKTSTIILSAAHLTAEIGKISQQGVPDVPNELSENRKRYSQITVINRTQFHIDFNGDYFDSGRYWNEDNRASSIDAFKQITFSVCQRDHAQGLCGVSGGTAFRIKLCDVHGYPFAIGWTNPQEGANKTCIVQQTSAKAGYEHIIDLPNSFDSVPYRGTDEGGKEMILKFHLEATLPRNAVYCITQVLV